MDEETRRIHRLLSDGKLSGPEAEEILQNVLAAGRRKQAPKVRAIHYWAGAALAAAAGILLVFSPRNPGAGVTTPTVESVDRPELRVRCSPGELAACPTSAKLVFSLSGASGLLSAYAEPLGHDAERAFYYSKQDGSPELPAASAAHPLRLPKPGRYRIHAVIADRPLTREELLQPAPARAGGAEIRAALQVEIVVRE